MRRKMFHRWNSAGGGWREMRQRHSETLRCGVAACGNGAKAVDRRNTEPKNHETLYLEAGVGF